MLLPILVMLMAVGPPSVFNTRSFHFDGATKLDGGTSALNYDYTQPLTVCAWNRSDANPTDKHSIMAREQAGSPFRGWDFLVEHDGRLILYQCGSWASSAMYVFSTASQTQNGVDWHFSCFSTTGAGNASGVQFYIDGASAGPTTISVNTLTTTIVDNSLHGLIGDAINTTKWLGELDEIYIFESVLTSGQIATLYRNGKPSNVSNFPNIAHWWRMGDLDDTTSSVKDRVGNWHMTTSGNGNVTSVVP